MSRTVILEVAVKTLKSAAEMNEKKLNDSKTLVVELSQKNAEVTRVAHEFNKLFKRNIMKPDVAH